MLMAQLKLTYIPRSMSKTIGGVMKEILGTAQSVGCTVDGEWYFILFHVKHANM